MLIVTKGNERIVIKDPGKITNIAKKDGLVTGIVAAAGFLGGAIAGYMRGPELYKAATLKIWPPTDVSKSNNVQLDAIKNLSFSLPLLRDEPAVVNLSNLPPDSSGRSCFHYMSKGNHLVIPAADVGVVRQCLQEAKADYQQHVGVQSTTPEFVKWAEPYYAAPGVAAIAGFVAFGSALGIKKVGTEIVGAFSRHRINKILKRVDAKMQNPPPDVTTGTAPIVATTDGGSVTHISAWRPKGRGPKGKPPVPRR